MDSKRQAQVSTNVSVGQWTHSVWDCFKPMDMCCMGYWCPCILFGKTHERMEDPTLRNYSTFNPWCVGHCALAMLGPVNFVLVMFDRKNMRERYGIAGSGGKDCALSFCCMCCALIQHEKEMIVRTQGQTEGYQREAPMTYPQ